VANLCASKCLNSTLSFVYWFLNIQSWRDPKVIIDNSQALFAKMMVYKKIMEQECAIFSYKALSYNIFALRKDIACFLVKKFLIKAGD